MAEYLHFTVHMEGVQGLRVPKGQPGAGQFVSATELRKELADRNRQRALELQAEVVENIPASIIRRNVSSRRLEHVTADPQNRRSTAFSYGVGVEDFLNHSFAKYWRTIEEGSEKVWADTPSGRASIIGMELKGIWGGSIGRITSSRVYGARPWSRHSSRRGDMFVPTSRTFNLRGRYEGTGGKSGAPNFAKSTTIKNEIQPHHDYAEAYRSYQPGRKSLQDISTLLGRASRAAWRFEV